MGVHYVNGDIVHYDYHVCLWRDFSRVWRMSIETIAAISIGIVCAPFVLVIYGLVAIIIKEMYREMFT